MFNLRKALFLSVLLLAVLIATAFNAGTTLADEDNDAALTFSAAIAATDGDVIGGAPNGGNPAAPEAQDESVPVCAIKAEELEPPVTGETLAYTPCVDGQAGEYACESVDLLANLPLATIGGGNGNDSWGWSYTDPTTNAVREFALMGRTNGTAFVEITDPINPVYLGNLPSHTGSSSWRDMKVYSNHVFIVSDGNGNHGMQVFDMMQLLNVASPPVTFAESAHYGNAGSVHNIAMNEATGFAYLIGGSSGAETCNGGLHMVNVQNPTAPTFAGCYADDGYTHDTQCVIYDGPDTEHQGKEICFSSNEDTLTITDVTDKANPVLLDRQPYAGSAYSHQGWLTADHRYFLLDDELDGNSGTMTATYVWDLLDLDDALNTGVFNGTTNAQDHNQYILGDYAYQANYKAGLRILDASDIANANLEEVAFFDTYPANNTRGYSGAWSNYPYFASGTIVVSDINRGLFLLRANLETPPPTAVEIASLSSAPSEGSNFALIAGIALAGIAVLGVALRRR